MIFSEASEDHQRARVIKNTSMLANKDKFLMAMVLILFPVQTISGKHSDGSCFLF